MLTKNAKNQGLMRNFSLINLSTKSRRDLLSNYLQMYLIKLLFATTII